MSRLPLLALALALVAQGALAVGCGGQLRDDATTASSSQGSPSPGSGTRQPGQAGQAGQAGAPAAPSVGTTDVAKLDGEATSMTADDTTLFVGMLDGRVLAVPKSGGAPAQLAAVDMASYPEGIAVDDAFVYVSSLTQRYIARVPKAGGAFEVIADDQNRPYQLVLDETHVYWVDQGSAVAGGSADDGRVLRRAKAGGPIEVLASGQQSPNALTLDDASVVFANGPWGDVNGSIRRVPKTGGDVQVLARHLETVDRVVLGSGKAWFVDSTSHQLAFVPLVGASAGGDATPTGGDPVDSFGLGSDGSAFVACTFDANSRRAALRRLGEDGHATATLAEWSYDRGVMPIASVATILDASRAFWIDLESSGAFGMRSTIRSASLR